MHMLCECIYYPSLNRSWFWHDNSIPTTLLFHFSFPSRYWFSLHIPESQWIPYRILTTANNVKHIFNHSHGYVRVVMISSTIFAAVTSHFGGLMVDVEIPAVAMVITWCHHVVQLCDVIYYSLKYATWSVTSRLVAW